MDELIEELHNLRNTTVIVEGPNDQKALAQFGVTNIVQLDKPLYKVVEDLEEEKEVAILTDLDSHGKKLYKYFYNELTKRGVRVNNKLRILLFKTTLRQIEGLGSFIQRA